MCSNSGFQPHWSRLYRQTCAGEFSNNLTSSGSARGPDMIGKTDRDYGVVELPRL